MTTLPHRDPDEHDPNDARRLRDAFGAFATGVTVVTTRGPDGNRVGLTANSLTSVSLDPPLLLFCPARTASALPTVEASQRFAINVLAADQQAVADRFARRDVDRFAEATWEDWDGLPILTGALANFACTMFADHDGGDHRVIIGRVERLRMNAERDPLLYFRGAYRRVHVPT
ncbi:flavin reductase family protein [Polymorphobacter sp. PAMC 29334]|uniref:flavin reductase family protein n=1 Tax=Polymorphobacter sp. PAMC 29334 TaxID=2862331 RepID=UPI001D00E792|nr:flavin reductase family protein [Polymorphobacter sp. PAMC 29334]